MGKEKGGRAQDENRTPEFSFREGYGRGDLESEN